MGVVALHYNGDPQLPQTLSDFLDYIYYIHVQALKGYSI